MPAIPAIIMGGAAIGSSLIASRSKKSSIDQTTTPLLTAEQQALFNPLKTSALADLNQPLPAGYQSQALMDINKNSSINDMLLKNKLTAMGLSNSPIAGNAALQSGINRTGELNKFDTYTLPMANQQFKNQAFQRASGLFGMLPSASHTTGTGVNSGLGAAGGVGAGLGSAAEMLAYMYGNGMIGGNNAQPAVSGTPPVPGFDFSAIAPILMQQQGGPGF